MKGWQRWLVVYLIAQALVMVCLLIYLIYLLMGLHTSLGMLDKLAPELQKYKEALEEAKNLIP